MRKMHYFVIDWTCITTWFVEAATPPLPVWQEDKIRERKHSARVSVHRGMFEESLELQQIGYSLRLEPLPDVCVVVAMTTTPTRINYIRPALESLLNQSQQPIVVLNVPNVYNSRRSHWKGKQIGAIPEWLAQLGRPPCPPCVIIHDVPQDWGPATKLIGTALAYSSGHLPRSVDDLSIVVAADDDHEWQPYALSTLIRQGFGRNNATEAIWSYFTYPYPRRTKPQVCVAQAGDMLAVRMHLLNLLPTWGTEVLENGRLPACFFVDDLLFAAYFKHTYDLTVYAHPWSYWIFKAAQRRNRALHLPNIPRCRGACSPVSIRLRYPDSLAMGPPREKHSLNCRDQLATLGWWPIRQIVTEICPVGHRHTAQSS